jgi:SAM-dependent methyltransferase
VATEYHRFRPRTPHHLLDWLLPPDAGTVIDLAAGTGALTELVAPRVGCAVAVEPDPGMRAVLHAAVPEAYVVAGSAEHLPLAAEVADALVVSSAWHWFDTERAAAEIGRVLRDGGRLAVVGNSLDHEIDWVARLRRPTHGGTQKPSAARVEIPPGAPFGPLERTDLRWTWRLTRDELLGLLATYSRVIVAGVAEQQALRAHALAVLEAQPETRGKAVLEVPMRTWAARATRATRATRGNRPA